MAQDEVKKEQQQKPSGWLCEVKAVLHPPQSVVSTLGLFLLKCSQTMGTDADEEKTIEMRPYCKSNTCSHGLSTELLDSSDENNS